MTRESQSYELTRKRKIIAGCVFLAIVFFITLFKGGVLYPKEPEELGADEMVTEVSEIGEAAKKEAEPSRIVVDLAGAVSQSGILILPEGSRVYEALEAGGGVRSDADLRDINLAAELLDGEKLYIPSKSEYAEISTTVHSEGGATASGGQKKVNINTANAEELQTLTGVGPSTADRILTYRKENGKFKSIEDLKNIKGIGEKTFAKLKDSISIT